MSISPINALRGFAFGGGTLVDYAIDDAIMMLSTEVLALNQPDADLCRFGDVQLGMRIAIALDAGGLAPPFSGFAAGQDGEISRLGPSGTDCDVWELAFFLHDFRNVGGQKFVVLSFRPLAISVMPTGVAISD